MKHIKTATLNVLIITLLQPLSMKGMNYEGAGYHTGGEASKELRAMVNDSMPLIGTASAAFGAKFGTEGLAMIGAGATKVGVAVKTAAVAVAASPATPFVVGGVAVGVGGYKTYRYMYPTNEEIAREEGFKAQAEKHRAEAEQYRAEAARYKLNRAEAEQKMASFGSAHRAPTAHRISTANMAPLFLIDKEMAAFMENGNFYE